MYYVKIELIEKYMKENNIKTREFAKAVCLLSFRDDIFLTGNLEI